ncbi:MAG: phage head-tail joining protein [Microbacteriaceae bacterium]
MAVSQTDIDNLNAAIAAGTRQVTIGGQTILYQTTESLIKARDDLTKELQKQTDAAAGKKRSRQMTAYHNGRGYC